MTTATRTSLQQHPHSALFPAMPEQELEALAQDIEKNGQREPGVIYEGMVLDGWHRYLACQKAGARFKSRGFDGDDPISFVVSQNLHRRHLTTSQRAMIAASLATKKQGRPEQTGNVAGLSQSEAAKALNVSERSVREAKRVADEAPDLAEEVRAGKKTVTTAARESDQRSGKKPAAEKKPQVVATERKFEKLYEAVKAELVETKEALAEMTEMAASAEAFKNKAEFKEMQNLRAELRAVKQRRGELMRENAEMRKDLAYWKKQAKKK